jgi:hypothetical protein
MCHLLGMLSRRVRIIQALVSLRKTTRSLSQLYDTPPGSFVTPLVTRSHMNEEYYGNNAKEFIGDRWVGMEKPAVMVSHSYLPWGLGR